MKGVPWIAWIRGEPVEVSPKELLSKFLNMEIRWIEHGHFGTDYPIFRITGDTQKTYGVRTVADLCKVPFKVLWP
jgi:hypothetical protein